MTGLRIGGRRQCARSRPWSVRVACPASQSRQSFAELPPAYCDISLQPDPSWWAGGLGGYRSPIGLGPHTGRQQWRAWGPCLERCRGRLEGYVAIAEEGPEARLEVSAEEEQFAEVDS